MMLFEVTLDSELELLALVVQTSLRQVGEAFGVLLPLDQRMQVRSGQ
jgi:hypothetical protein